MSSIFKRKESYHYLLSDICNVDFDAPSSTIIIPDIDKIDKLLSFAILYPDTIVNICHDLEHQMISELPNHHLTGHASLSHYLGSCQCVNDDSIDTTVNSNFDLIDLNSYNNSRDISFKSIRKCEFYLDIWLRFITKGASTSIMIGSNNQIDVIHSIRPFVIRIIYKLLIDVNMIYYRQLQQLLIIYSQSNPDDDYTIFLNPLIKILSSIDVNTSNPMIAMEILNLLLNLIKSPELLQPFYKNIISLLMNLTTIQAFEKWRHKITNTAIVSNAVVSNSQLIADKAIDSLIILVSIPTANSLINFITVIIDYYDSDYWIDRKLAVELLHLVDINSLIKYGTYAPTIVLLLQRVNSYLTMELSSHIVKAEMTPSLTNSSSAMPSSTITDYTRTIIEVVIDIIELEASSLKSLTNIEYPLNSNLLKNIYQLMHILWCCVAWKAFYCNIANENDTIDVVLSPIDLSNPWTSSKYIPSDDIEPLVNKAIDKDITIDNSIDRSIERSIDSLHTIISITWRCYQSLIRHQFPYGTVRASILPSIHQIIVEKTRKLIENPKLRLDLLIPGKNAMYTYILHAMNIVLAYHAPLLSGNTMIEEKINPLTDSLLCELVLLVRSMQWTTQRYAILIFIQLFNGKTYDRLVNKSNNKLNRSIDKSSEKPKNVVFHENESIESHVWLPFLSSHLVVVRDTIFTTLCTENELNQVNATIALYQLQVSMTRAFGFDDVLATIPMLLALQEFWLTYSTNNLSNNLSKQTNDKVSNSPDITNPDEVKVSIESTNQTNHIDIVNEMLNCQRSYFLCYFLFIAKEFDSKTLEKCIVKMIKFFDSHNKLSRHLTIDLSNGQLVSNVDINTHVKNGVSYQLQRVDQMDLISGLTACKKIHLTTHEVINKTFEVLYFPQADPFTRLQELTMSNVSRTLFED